METKRTTTKRKRDAATDLRTLAGEVNVGDRGRNSDLNSTDFENLYRSVLASCATPEQKTRAEAARELYVESLCKGLPQRIDDLIATDGGRLEK